MIGNIDILVKELCKLPKEVGWVEFKHNNCEPTMIGEDISALANSATLNDRDYAYKIWGVDKGGSIQACGISASGRKEDAHLMVGR
jgi:hypothetical protein